MIRTDTQIRDALLEACHRGGLDTSTLTVEIQGNALIVKETVASEEDRRKLWGLLETVDSRITEITSHVRVVAIPASDRTPVPAPSSPARPQHPGPL